MTTISGKDIHKVVVACDAGMGSSVMLASQLRKQLKPYSVTVEHSPVDSIPDDADLIVVHAGLAQRARAGKPGKPIIGFQVFIGDPAVAKVVAAIRDGGVIDG